MSSALSCFIGLIVSIYIIGCFWLIRVTSKTREGEADKGQVTGHTWDENLQEYNNPMPRWWLGLYIFTGIFAVIYLIIYPGFGRFAGIADWTQINQYDTEVANAEKVAATYYSKYVQQDIAEVAKNPEAVAMGKRLFMTYCTACHGSDARGTRKYPNLTDDDWLYGGSPTAIKTSIMEGRNGVMPPMAAAIGGVAGVDEVATYVLSLSGKQVDAAKATAGQAKFAICAGCHGMDGKGNHMIGAPNLTDDTWLYGGDLDTIRTTITTGRNGVMPAQKTALGPDRAHVLAAYIYSISH